MLLYIWTRGERTVVYVVRVYVAKLLFPCSISLHLSIILEAQTIMSVEASRLALVAASSPGEALAQSHPHPMASRHRSRRPHPWRPLRRADLPSCPHPTRLAIAADMAATAGAFFVWRWWGRGGGVLFEQRGRLGKSCEGEGIFVYSTIIWHVFRFFLL